MTISARRFLSALATLSLAATALIPMPGRASADPACTRHVLNIVAHHDDDMFFLSPDLIGELADPTVCVRTVFLVASNYMEPAYVEAREAGIRDAYAVAAGPGAGTWLRSPYSVGGFTAIRYTLGNRISIIESRIPDNATGGWLWQLYADNTALTTLAGEDNTPPQQLDRTSLRSFLRGVATDFQPDVINTLDPTADQHPSRPLEHYDAMRFHPDHVATTRMVMWTFPDIPVRFYRDYTTFYEAENVTGTTLDTRLQVFAAYLAHDNHMQLCDPRAPRDEDDPCQEGYHWDWLRRQYRADHGWMRNLVVPLPPSGRPGPYLGHTYRIENVFNDLAMTVSTSNAGEMLRLWADTNSDGQRWRMEVVQTGWRLVNVRSGLCLAVSDPNAGALAIQKACAGSDPMQIFTIETGFLGGMTLRSAHAAAQDFTLHNAGNAGTAITQQGGHNAGHEWRAVPVS